MIHLNADTVTAERLAAAFFSENEKQYAANRHFYVPREWVDITVEERAEHISSMLKVLKHEAVRQSYQGSI